MKNKTLKIIGIIFLSILVVIASIFYVNIIFNKNGINLNLNLGISNVSNELVFNEEYETIFETININSNSSNIIIKQNNESKVKVLIYGDKELTSVNVLNNQIDIISSAKSCIGICFFNQVARIEIYLPQNYSGNINITNNYGDINIDKFDNLTLYANLDAGDIKANSLLFGKIESSYGDIEILGYSDELDINQESGDVTINEVNRIKVSNNYGDIEIQKVNYYLDIVDDCGDIEIDYLTLYEDSKIENDYGDVDIGMTNEIYIDAKTDLGDLKINNNYRTSNITLTINNDCGDIEIDN